MLFFFTICAFIFGTVIGSFLSVLIYRLRVHRTHNLSSRSICVSCKKPVAFFDLIPLVSYLVLRGNCRGCSKPISIYYPLIELFTGALFALMYTRFPFFSEDLAFSGHNTALFIVYCYFMSVLSFSFFYDLKYMLVSDRVMIPAILIALVATLLPGMPQTIDALLGAGLAFVFFALQIYLSKGKWLGGGDVRVGVFMGMMLGWQLTLVALFVSYIVGSITAVATLAFAGAGRQSKVPFVPFLVIGTLTAVFVGKEIIHWYLRGN